MSVTVVYRSAADLKKAEFWYEEGPKMQERAIKAEAEVERLKLMVKSITGGLDECIETVHFLEAENAKLRKVVEAAREYMTVFNETPGYYESLDECVRLKEVLRQALAELDEADHD